MPKRGENISGVQEEEEVTGVLDGDKEESISGADAGEEPEVPSDFNIKESASDTISRFKENEPNVPGGGEKEEAEGQDSETTPEAVKVSQERDKAGRFAKGAKKTQDAPPPMDDAELLPPERLTAPEREAFNKAPNELKKGIHRMVKDLERRSDKERSEYLSGLSEIRGIKEAAYPFAEEWAQFGRTIPQAIAELGGFQRKLSHKDPAVREEYYLKLARQAKVDLVKLANKQLGNSTEGAPQNNLPDISNHPRVQELESKIISLQKLIEPLHSSHQVQSKETFDRTVEQIVSEIDAVRNEVNESGEFKYPKLFDADYLESAKPLASALKRSVPNLSWGDAYRRAYHSMEGTPLPTALGNSQQPNQARPHVPISTRAVSAATTSARGRGAPVLTNGATAEPPPEAMRANDAKSTMDWIRENFGRGG